MYYAAISAKEAKMKYLIRKPDTFMSTLNDEINTILKKSFDTVFPEYILEKEIDGMSMPVDIQEFDDEYKVKAEIPGVKKEDLDIDINKTSVTISAKKQEEKTEKNHKYHKTEFRYGNYSRTIYFPDEINLKEAQARLEHGVLHLDLPKLKKSEEENRKLEVK